MKTGLSVGDAMTTKPICVTPNKTVQYCAQLMIKKKVGSLLVVENKKLLGILTEKDIVKQIVAKHLSAKKLTAKDIMVKRIKTIEPDKDLFYIMNFMKKHKVKRLPVVHDTKLQGLLTVSDVLKVQPALLEIAQESGFLKKATKENYSEGMCNGCENFAQLHERDGQFLCQECLDEMGELVKED
tara:strand:+ start:854 stop:1405 length:552 start_codon:yes stop_codon:yes gene_type:complete